VSRRTSVFPCADSSLISKIRARIRSAIHGLRVLQRENSAEGLGVLLSFLFFFFWFFVIIFFFISACEGLRAGMCLRYIAAIQLQTLGTELLSSRRFSAGVCPEPFATRAA